MNLAYTLATTILRTLTWHEYLEYTFFSMLVNLFTFEGMSYPSLYCDAARGIFVTFHLFSTEVKGFGLLVSHRNSGKDCWVIHWHEDTY